MNLLTMAISLLVSIPLPGPQLASVTELDYVGRRPNECAQIVETHLSIETGLRFGRFSRVIVTEATPREPALPARRLILRQAFPTAAAGSRSYLLEVIVNDDRADELYKQTVTSQDDSGTTLQQINHLGQIWKYWWNSHHENEGHGQRLLSSDPMTEEQLLLWLPTLDWEVGRVIPVELHWGLHDHHARGHLGGARIHCTTRQALEVPAGKFECWIIEVASETRTSTFAIDTAKGAAVIRYETSDGVTLELKQRRASTQ